MDFYSIIGKAFVIVMVTLAAIRIVYRYKAKRRQKLYRQHGRNIANINYNIFSSGGRGYGAFEEFDEQNEESDNMDAIKDENDFEEDDSDDSDSDSSFFDSDD